MTGYVVYGQLNDSLAFREQSASQQTKKVRYLHDEIVPDLSGQPRVGVSRCRACGELLAKWDEPLAGLRVKRRYFDVSSTLDGVLLVSNRFQAVYAANNLTGLQFWQLPDDPDFSKVEATSIVQFDADRRGTRFENRCEVCGRYESVIGATPVFLKPGNRVPDLGFARTDLEFASGDEKHPLLLCGPSAGKILESSKLRGLDLVTF